MSFIGFMKRLVMGQPLFDGQQPIPPGSPPVSADQPASFTRKGDSTTFPVVQITRVDNHFNGSNLQVYCRIRNNSRERIVLDKIRLLGTARQITDDLQPNEEREYVVYEGPPLQNQAYHDAQLDYRTESGDYFEADHDVTFSYQADNKTYLIDEVRLHTPIRDIYG